MKALVTGGGGFIGRHVVQALAAAGAQVRCLAGPPGSGLAAPTGATETFEADIRDTHTLQEHAAESDVVVHLAGPPSVAGSYADPCEYVRVHVEGTACVLEASRRASVAHVVYMSSAEVYGAPDSNPVDEDHPARPRSPYGAAKAGAEALVEAYQRCYGRSAVVLRPFSVYGPGASPQSLIGRILSQLRSGEDVVVQDLRPVRDYCFVTDVARAVVLASSAHGEHGVFNIGSMEGTSVAAIASLLKAASGTNARIIEDASRRRRSDVLQLVADNRRAKLALGWQPEVELTDGLRSVWRGDAACGS
jgi:nucleoside-diphosphate-sugar epimerase